MTRCPNRHNIGGMNRSTAISHPGLPHASLALLMLFTGLFLLPSPAGGSPPEPLLPRPLARLTASGPLARQGVGLYAQFLDTGETLASLHPDDPLIPASTLKLLTTACALDQLGPSYRFRLRFHADVLPNTQGLVTGALYIHGSGNPDWSPGDLLVAVRGLAAAGIKTIRGDLVADDTLFEPPGIPASWPGSLKPSPYNAPQGALALSWNSTEVVVLPGNAVGEAARVSITPLENAIPLINRARTGSATEITAGIGTTPEGSPAIVVQGTIRPGEPPFRTWINLVHPTWAVLHALVSELRAAGITLEGRPRLGRVPEGAPVILEQESAPLATLVAEINKPSNNFGAEVLARSLAAEQGIRPATTAAGTERMRACLAAWGIDPQGLVIVDGSGFGRDNRLTARVLVALLRTAYHQPGWGPELMVSLPRGGDDGSLRRRFHDLRQRVRAKTGTLNGVASLAGYAFTRAGRPLAFAILLNQEKPGEGVGHHWTDRLTRALLVAAEAAPPPATKKPSKR